MTNNPEEVRISFLQNNANPYTTGHSEMKQAFISPDLALSADKRKLFNKMGYKPYTRNKGTAESMMSSMPESARQIDSSLIANAEKSPDVSLFLRSSNKADSSFYEKRISVMANVRNKTQERQREVSQSINAQRRVKNMRSEKIPFHDIPSDDSPFCMNDYYGESSKTSALNRKTEQLSFYNTPDHKDSQYQTFQSEGKQPILVRRLLRHNKQIQQDNLRMDTSASKTGEASNKSCNSGFTGSFIRQAGAFSAVRPVKQNLINHNSILKQLPTVKGIQPSLLMELYEAKCQDLRINPSKVQMLRFHDMITKNCSKSSKKLNLADFGLGDAAVKVICRILKYNNHFTSVDLKKNMITSSGLINLGKCLLQNTRLVHFDIGCNQITSEGAEEFFNMMHRHPSLTSINLANEDCYKNKNKIGIKGAQALGKLIAANHLISMIDLTDNALSQEAIHYIVEGIRKNPQVIYVNLSQNDLGTSQNGFSHMLSIFKSGQNTQNYHCLEELNVSSNQLTNKNIEELTDVLNSCTRVNLKKLNLSNNKFSAKGLMNLLQCFRTNNQVKLTHLSFDKADVEPGTSQESLNNERFLNKAMVEFLKFSKTLEYLSLASCGVTNSLMNAIGKGLQQNERLSTLILRGNHIEDEGLNELAVAMCENKNLKLRNLDFSSNKINEEGGILLAQSIKHVQTMQQVNLRDNLIGNEASDAFLFLVKEKPSLWKVQLDLNVIKYVTLVEIEKTCKKNKKAKKNIKIPHIQSEINSLVKVKDPRLKADALDRQLKDQQKLINQGFQKVVEEEEIVHDIIKEGDMGLRELEEEIIRLKKVQDRLDDVLLKKDKQIFEKQREWERKLDDEKAMIEKCNDYISKNQVVLENQRGKVVQRKETQQKTGEEQKLREELDRIQKEQDMMLIIIENYEKEIQRKQSTTQTSSPRKEQKEESNALLHILREEKQMFRGEVCEGKDGQKIVMVKDSKEPKRKGSKKRGKSKKVVVKHIKGL